MVSERIHNASMRLCTGFRTVRAAGGGASSAPAATHIIKEMAPARITAPW